MALTTRASSATVGGTSKMALNRENTESMLLGKSMVTRAASQRSALGDIGNKVSAITLDPSKKAVKKEVLLPSTKPKAFVKTKATSSLKSLADQEPIVDNVFAKPEMAAPKAVVAHNISQAAVPAPMDISEDKPEAFSKAFFNIEDIDANDKENPQLVSDYVNDIYAYMKFLEKRFTVKPNYLQDQEISGKMRSILIDWLCQVHHRFHLLPETLYLTVSIIDRFLQVHPVPRNKLQLVGVTSMLVASKYEEMYAPEVADFVYITDNAYTKQEIRNMESVILKTLDFSLGKPLCLHFLRRNSKAGQVDATKHTLAKFLMELTITEYDMVQCKPSEIAAAALCLSMKLLDGSKWTDTLVHYSSYTEAEIVPTMQKLANLVVKAETSKLTAVRAKYSSSKFMKISTIPELKTQLLKDLAMGTDSS